MSEEKTVSEEKQDEGELRSGLKLIKMMKTDILAAVTARAPLIIEGEALGALLTVVQVAEKATVSKLATIRADKVKIVPSS